MLEFTLLSLCGLWIAGLGYLFWAAYRVPQFHDLQFTAPRTWPRLSVVIPACNEADHIESAVASLLAQDYPDFEIILIDDRSTDGTGEIVDRLAASDRRVRALHVTALPEGWLGKVHALARGVEVAAGDWLLFTDADVHFAPATLSRAVGFAVDRRIDHLALAPLAVQRNLWLDVAVHGFTLLFMIGTRAAGINQPQSKAFVGVGAFNLVRRTALARTPGFSWLRLEPCDDVGLGLMIKRAGGRSFFAIARQQLTVAWYPSLAAMFKGLEKNLFGASASYRWWVTLIQVAGLLALAAAPALSVAIGFSQSRPLVLWVAIAVLALLGLFSFYGATEGWRGRLSLLLAPVGFAMIAAMMANAAWRCLTHNGIDWRGTRYPLAQLRAGQRVKLGEDCAEM